MMKNPVEGIYISWPFCAQKCTYCNFASGVHPHELESRYLDALLREISLHTSGGLPTLSTWAVGLPVPWKRTISIAC